MKVNLGQDDWYVTYLKQGTGEYEMNWFKVQFCKFANVIFEASQNMLDESRKPSRQAAKQRRQQEAKKRNEEAVSYCFTCDNTKKVLIHAKGCNDDRGEGTCSLCFASDKPCPDCIPFEHEKCKECGLRLETEVGPYCKSCGRIDSCRIGD